MAEHEAERTGGEDGRESLPAEGTARPVEGVAPEAADTPAPGDGRRGGDRTDARDAAPSSAPAPAEKASADAGRPDDDGRGEGPDDDGRGEGPDDDGRGEGPGDGRLDEDAAWNAIVAGYGEEPPDPPGARPFRSIEDLAGLEDDRSGVLDPDKGIGKKAPGPPERPLGSSVVFAPGVGGPRDYELAKPKDDDLDDTDEGHFVPPEPPPLPEADVTAKFAWLAVVGGPVLMLLAVLLRWEITWWLGTVCVGGFVGGFITLVARMGNDDEDEDDPGRGAVV
ncbi:hypothetical protein AMK22_25395 [Streptomyces sp. CB01580]|nr:hypothetical protein [Streptomyces sp. CB01580]OKJ31876.1 hypothetical protein AMK22_25395 [Streptomyces sp. CB01580]